MMQTASDSPSYLGMEKSVFVNCMAIHHGPEDVLIWPGSGTTADTAAAIGANVWLSLWWSIVILQNLSGIRGGTGE